VTSSAARRARQKAFKSDLTRAYSDEEASPPEWLDLLNSIRGDTKALRIDIDGETKRFVAESDIRAARAFHACGARHRRAAAPAVPHTAQRGVTPTSLGGVPCG
jgi:hypothetical protein